MTLIWRVSNILQYIFKSTENAEKNVLFFFYFHQALYYIIINVTMYELLINNKHIIITIIWPDHIYEW